ncbi:MAG: DVU0298 family protein [Thermodesulfovibrionaceae bacterium]
MRKQATTCLFCGRLILPPENRITEIGEVIYGRCECGAIYVCDPTGHSQGETLLEAMLLLSPEGIEDIDLGVNVQMKEHDYDWKTHQYLYGKGLLFSGKLIFLRYSLNKEDGKKKTLIRKVNKKEFLEMVKERQFETIREICKDNKNVVGWIISFSYDKEDILSWKAIETMGHVAEEYVKADYLEDLRNTIRKLLWSMSEESGGVGWRAAELIAEIIYTDPELFKDIIPILWSQREEKSFLESVLRGVIKLSKKVKLSEYINFDCEELNSLLKNEEDQIKALVGILAERVGCEIPENIRKLHLLVYKNGRLLQMEAVKAEKFL